MSWISEIKNDYKEHGIAVLDILGDMCEEVEVKKILRTELQAWDRYLISGLNNLYDDAPSKFILRFPNKLTNLVYVFKDEKGEIYHDIDTYETLINFDKDIHFDKETGILFEKYDDSIVTFKSFKELIESNNILDFLKSMGKCIKDYHNDVNQSISSDENLSKFNIRNLIRNLKVNLKDDIVVFDSEIFRMIDDFIYLGYSYKNQCCIIQGFCGSTSIDYDGNKSSFVNEDFVMFGDPYFDLASFICEFRHDTNIDLIDFINKPKFESFLSGYDYYVNFEKLKVFICLYELIRALRFAVKSGDDSRFIVGGSCNFEFSKDYVNSNLKNCLEDYYNGGIL